MKELRTSRRLSLPEVAAGSGISYQQLQKYEAGRNSLSARRLAKIAMLFDMDAPALLNPPTSKDDCASLSDSESTQRRGERARLLKAYFALPQVVRQAFLKLLEGAGKH
ncbi:helix-turn-helix transcriptional regulator [Paracoccus sp. IB05]|nr:helix-turn-helix transcriptional regulator [Paracoccus sp. IB05]